MFRTFTYRLADGNGLSGGNGSTTPPADTKADSVTNGGQSSTPAPLPNTTPPNEADIKDPLAKARADAEMFKRLLDKANTELETVKGSKTLAETELADRVKTELETLKTQVSQELERAREATLSATRARVAHENGLGNEALPLLTATDEAELKKQADAIKALLGKGGNTPPTTSNKGNPASGAPLTHDTIKGMSTNDVLAQLDSVLASLSKK